MVYLIGALAGTPAGERLVEDLQRNEHLISSLAQMHVSRGVNSVEFSLDIWLSSAFWWIWFGSTGLFALSVYLPGAVVVLAVGLAAV